VKSAPGQGANFCVYLPRCMEAVPSSAPSISPIQKPLSAGRTLVLVVEDEAALREAITDHLRDHGYQVLAAADGIEALDVLARNPDTSILISDLIMPRMGGRELVRLAAKQLPHLHIILMSGYDDQDFREEDDTELPTILLQKPFAMNLLLTRIAELNQRPDLCNNRVGVYAVLGQEFGRLAGARQFGHGQLVDFDAVGAEFACHGIAQAAFGIMVLDRHDEVLRLLRGGFDNILGQRLDAVGVNDRDPDALSLQGVGGL